MSVCVRVFNLIATKISIFNNLSKVFKLDINVHLKDRQLLSSMIG